MHQGVIDQIHTGFNARPLVVRHILHLHRRLLRPFPLMKRTVHPLPNLSRRRAQLAERARPMLVVGHIAEVVSSGVQGFVRAMALAVPAQMAIVTPTFMRMRMARAKGI